MSEANENEGLSRTAQNELQRAWIVGKVGGENVTWGELHDAFERVKPRPNWKHPISARFTTSANAAESAREVAMIREAVIFFCGCVPEIRHVGNFRFTCEAVGYYAAVGA